MQFYHILPRLICSRCSPRATGEGGIRPFFGIDRPYTEAADPDGLVQVETTKTDIQRVSTVWQFPHLFKKYVICWCSDLFGSEKNTIQIEHHDESLFFSLTPHLYLDGKVGWYVAGEPSPVGWTTTPPPPSAPRIRGFVKPILFGRLPVVYFGYVINLHPHYDTPIEYGYSGYPQSARFLLAKLHFFAIFLRISSGYPPDFDKHFHATSG